MNQIAARKSKPQRARPMPRAERRTQLLSVARGIIRKKGIGGLTMSGLAEAAGASKPVVYEHFENAEAVAVALLENYFETMIDLVAARTANAQTLDEYLSIAIDTQFEYHRKDKLVVRSMTNGHSSSERLNEAYLKLRDSSVETLEELIRQQGASPEASSVAGYVLWDVITGAVFEFGMRPDGEAAQENLKRMVLGAIHAIVPESRTKPVTPAKILATARAFKQSRGE